MKATGFIFLASRAAYQCANVGPTLMFG